MSPRSIPTTYNGLEIVDSEYQGPLKEIKYNWHINSSRYCHSLCNLLPKIMSWAILVNSKFKKEPNAP